MSERMKLACEAAGLVLIVAGLALIYIPAATIAAGVALILVGNTGGDA